MRLLFAISIASSAFVSLAIVPRENLPKARANRNTDRGGALSNGVLTVALEAKQSLWYPYGEAHAGVSNAAFAEEGKAPSVPGPLIRVPVGTQLHVSVRNSLSTPITFFLPTALRGEGSGSSADSVVIDVGAIGTLNIRATRAGNYVYRAMRSITSRQSLISGQLSGAIVIDSAGAPNQSHDRVFVMTQGFAPDTSASNATNNNENPAGSIVYQINGQSWPNTEHIDATEGDSLHWRIINASAEQHPMHLHGFFFRVDDFSPASTDRVVRGAPKRTVVTERMSPLSGMSMSWKAERVGNWIFHCHFAIHMMPDLIPGEHADHAMTGMGGLVLGVNIAARKNTRRPAELKPKRHLRLVAVKDSGFANTEPSMRFVLEEGTHRIEAGTAFSPTMVLTRGEPVSITVVNHLDEPTSVHWHGIELDSYNDGVAGVSGSGAHLAPLIAPRDSFEVRFRPPRAGTFMYHSHVDEVRQHAAGLAGALIVREPGSVQPSPDDYVFFLKGSRQPNAAGGLEVNGRSKPDTIVMRLGHPARLRFMSLASINPTATVSLTTSTNNSLANINDSNIVVWRALAKDGADLPQAERSDRKAQQVVSMGETFDFEYQPSTKGLMRLEVRGYGANGTLLATVPIIVR